jgi:aminoethylphosphonate catabolism LysR family transcriptional regulator
VHGSFTRAAEALHVTQPTLSGQVRELEDRYRIKLFTRYGRKVDLTDLGQSTFEITRKVFRAEQEVEQLFLAAKGLSEGELTVGADSPYIITPLLAAYQRRYPGVRISIRYGNSAELLKWLQSQRCDIAILANVPEGGPRLEVLQLQPGRLVAFVNQDHLWASRRSVSLEEIVSQRVILREKGSHTRSIFEQALNDAELKLNNLMQIGSREGVREAVAAGLGIGIVSAAELGTDTRFHTLQVKDAELLNSEYIITLHERHQEQPIHAFIDMVSDAIKTGSINTGLA